MIQANIETNIPMLAVSFLAPCKKFRKAKLHKTSADKSGSKSMGMSLIEKLGTDNPKISIKRQNRDNTLYCTYWSTRAGRIITERIKGNSIIGADDENLMWSSSSRNKLCCSPELRGIET
jgi:hypothetical protein